MSGIRGSDRRLHVPVRVSDLETGICVELSYNRDPINIRNVLRTQTMGEDSHSAVALERELLRDLDR